MKLIIDIPEEVLNYLQPFKDICYQKIKEGTDSEHEHMLKALYEGTPLDDVKAEFINSYPKNYAGTPEFGGMFCHFTLNDVLKALDNAGKGSEEV